MARQRTVDREFANSAGRYSGAPSYFEWAERVTQRTTAHDLIEFPDVCVSERALDDDEQNELRREIALLAMKAMEPEEA